MSIRLINCFEVPVGADEKFLEFWSGVHAYMIRKSGYLSHELNRALSDQAHFRYINYVHWTNAADFAAAQDEGFRALVRSPAAQSFPSTPPLAKSSTQLGHADVQSGVQSA